MGKFSVRAFELSNKFHAFEVSMKSGSKIVCKTPKECEDGLTQVIFLENHPENTDSIMSIELPCETDNFSWFAKR